MPWKCNSMEMHPFILMVTMVMFHFKDIQIMVPIFFFLRFIVCIFRHKRFFVCGWNSIKPKQTKEKSKTKGNKILSNLFALLCFVCVCFFFIKALTKNNIPFDLYNKSMEAWVIGYLCFVCVFFVLCVCVWNVYKRHKNQYKTKKCTKNRLNCMM